MNKPVIFDMDGVLVNSERMHFQALNRTLARATGRTMDWNYYSQFVGSTMAHMWQVLDHDFELQGNLAAMDRAYAADKAYFLAQDGHMPVPGAPALVRALHAAGCPLAVASSSPMFEIQAVVQAFGLTQCFDVLVTGADLARPKPAPDIFLHTAKLLGAAPSDCRVIEDSANGVRAAKAAGMYCIGFVNPDSGAQDLSPADIRVDHMADCLPLLTAPGTAAADHRSV